MGRTRSILDRPPAPGRTRLIRFPAKRLRVDAEHDPFSLIARDFCARWVNVRPKRPSAQFSLAKRGAAPDGAHAMAWHCADRHWEDWSGVVFRHASIGAAPMVQASRCLFFAAKASSRDAT